MNSNVDFSNAMAERSGSEVPPSKTLSHREAVLPFLRVGSRWELLYATTIFNSSIFESLRPVVVL